MSKEYLEALNDLMGFIEERDNYFGNKWINEDYETIKQALQRLESIENANPNEALECLEHIKKDDFNMIITTYPPLPAYNGVTKDEMFNKIEQALLKAEQEKELKEQKELLDILKNKPFILQKIFEEKGLKNQKEFDHKYFWGTITEEEEFKIMRWLDEQDNKKA